MAKPKEIENKDIVEQPQVEQPQVEQPQVEQPQVEQPQVEQPQVEQPQVEQPQVEQPQVEDTSQKELLAEIEKLKKAVAKAEAEKDKAKAELDAKEPLKDNVKNGTIVPTLDEKYGDMTVQQRFIQDIGIKEIDYHKQLAEVYGTYYSIVVNAREYSFLAGQTTRILVEDYTVVKETLFREKNLEGLNITNDE